MSFRNLSIYLYLLAFILAEAWWHAQAGASLPTPCGDEVVFYYPAQSLAQHGTLASPHLHPGRPLHWMPPGYEAVLALWMKAFGYGLWRARWLSFLFSACAFGGAYCLWRMLKLPAASLLLLGWAFLSPHWVVVGNMIRMEGLLLCLLLPAFQFLWRGKTLAAVGLTLLALTIHPNAVYVLIAIPALAWVASAWSWKGPLNLSLAALGLVVAGGYAGYFLLNWADFRYDWAWQFSLRTPGGLQLLLFRPDQAVFLLLVAGLAWWAWKTSNRAIGFALSVALLFWAMRILGQGWSYGIFNVLALVLVLSCALAWFREALAPRLSPSQAKILPWVAALALGTGLVPAHVFVIPFRWQGYQWMGMQMQNPAQPVFTRSDQAAVRSYLATHLPKLTRLYVIPEGEGILIAPEDSGVRHVLPVFGENLPTHFLLHDNEAPFFKETIEEVFKTYLPGQPRPAPFYVRGTNRWYLVQVEGGRYPPFILLKGDSRLPEKL